MNKFFIFLTCLINLSLFSQNKKILFNFTEVPQTLMINPGAETNFEWHAGLPLISGAYIHIGMSNFTMNNLFKNDNIDFNTKLENVLNKLNNNDFYTANQQLEIFNIGFRLPDTKNYLSAGFYEEFDAIIYHPKDLITLTYEGNSDFNKKFNFSDLSFKAEMLGVFHIGINRKVNKKLIIGGRFKVYSSVFNISSTRNQGFYFTTEGTNNFYRHHLQNANIRIKTSGIIHNQKSVIDKKVINRFLASGNMGIGLDFGLTYHFNKQWTTTASFQDLGFIRHTKNTTVYRIKGSQYSEGINLEFPADNPIDYLEKFNDDFPSTARYEKFTTLRSLKLNGALIYNFGQIDNSSCIRKKQTIKRRNEVGIQLYSIFRPKRPQATATLFYYRKLAKYLRAKLTYTADSYSIKNVGIGLSTHIGVFNMYGSIDNILGLNDLSKSKNQTINFGINFQLDVDKNKP